MSDDTSGRNAALIAVLGGAVVALVVVLVVVQLQGGDESPATTIAADTTAPSTTAPATTAPDATVTSATAPATTDPGTTTAPTTTTTTTMPPFVGNTEPKQGGIVGTPGGQLADVRWAKQPGFTRVVFDFTGTGLPSYQIGYAPAPFQNTAGDVVPVDGGAFLLVTVFPAMRWDITDPDNLIQVYTGPERIGIGAGSIAEVVFLEDFEANLQWVIGVNAEKDFAVGTLLDPPRIYVDIAD